MPGARHWPPKHFHDSSAHRRAFIDLSTKLVDGSVDKKVSGPIEEPSKLPFVPNSGIRNLTQHNQHAKILTNINYFRIKMEPRL